MTASADHDLVRVLGRQAFAVFAIALWVAAKWLDYWVGRRGRCIEVRTYTFTMLRYSPMLAAANIQNRVAHHHDV